MALRDLLLIGDPRLRERASEADLERDDLDAILRDLEDTLTDLQRRKGIGRALAAVQIGIPRRVVLMQVEGLRFVLVNPRITRRSEESFELWDSCYSADVAFFGRVRRARTITVEFLDERGAERREIFSGDLAELFQHEIDHLDGILFTDHILDNRIIMRAEWEKLFTREGIGLCRQ